MWSSVGPATLVGGWGGLDGEVGKRHFLWNVSCPFWVKSDNMGTLGVLAASTSAQPLMSTRGQHCFKDTRTLSSPP